MGEGEGDGYDGTVCTLVQYDTVQYCTVQCPVNHLIIGGGEQLYQAMER